MSDQSCVFCKIAAKTEPAHIIYEDQDFIALLDRYPKTWGHTQVIPKQHFRWVWDMPNIAQYFTVVNRIIQHYKQILAIETCYQTVWGNQVAHAHVQILPAYKEIHKPITLSEEEVKEVLGRLRMDSGSLQRRAGKPGMTMGRG